MSLPVNTQFEALEQISVKSIRSNIVQTPDGLALRAGGHQFSSLWTRDFCFSVSGLLSIGRADIVKNHLNLLLDHARSTDGLIPRGLDDQSPKKRVVRYLTQHRLHLPQARRKMKKLRPEYYGEHGTEAIDSNALVIIAAHTYLKSTQDKEWYESQLEKLKMVYNYYNDKKKSGLIFQGKYSDWQDSVKREGHTFYTNLLYWKASQILGIETKEIEEKIRLAFFNDDQGIFRTHTSLSAASLEGNLLAIEWGFEPLGVSSSRVYISLKKSALWTKQQGPGFATWPSYPKDWVSWTTKLVGLENYHDKLYWSWLLAKSAKVAITQNDHSEALTLLTSLEGLATRDKWIAEVYQPNVTLSLFDEVFYRSELPFSWGAATTLETLAKLRD